MVEENSYKYYVQNRVFNFPSRVRVLSKSEVWPQYPSHDHRAQKVLWLSRYIELLVLSHACFSFMDYEILKNTSGSRH